MQTGYIFRLVIMGLLALVLGSACTEDTPSRENIPVLKERIYVLQEAIRERNRPMLDSLLSSRILTYDQSSDSLLSFCWGPDNSFAFERLGDCEIFYTDDKAFADCFVMDSTGTKERPIHLRFINQGDVWLLERFLDSTQVSGAEE